MLSARIGTNIKRQRNIDILQLYQVFIIRQLFDMYLEFIGCSQVQIKKWLQITTGFFAKKLLHIIRTYQIIISILRTGCKLLQGREEQAITHYVSQGMHKEGPF